jgi:hypothetical protein
MRTILAVVLAVAITLVPAGAAGVPGSGTGGPSAARLAANMVDCIHHGAAHERGARDKGQKADDGCASMAACAVKCFSYAGTVLPGIAPAPTAWRLAPVTAAGLLVVHTGSPPFRPPRI